MNTIPSQNSTDERDYYLKTVTGLFWPKWILSWYIVGLDINPLVISMEKLADSSVSIHVSPFHTVNLPEIWIQRNTEYDCFLWSEKKLMLKFKVNSEGKISLFAWNIHMVRPNLITIVESNWESGTLSNWILSRLKNKIWTIFASKK